MSARRTGINTRLLLHMIPLALALSAFAVLLKKPAIEEYRRQDNEHRIKSYIDYKFNAVKHAFIEDDPNKLQKLAIEIADQSEVTHVEIIAIDSNGKRTLAAAQREPITENKPLPYSYSRKVEDTDIQINIKAATDFQVSFRKRTIFFLVTEEIIQTTAFYFILFIFFRLHVIKRLEIIAKNAQQIASDDLRKPSNTEILSKTSRDEFDDVEYAIEYMRTKLLEDYDRRRAMELALIAEKEEREESQRLIEDARASDRAKSQFIATMSHEIRTPMNGVIGMLDLLKNTELNEEQTQYTHIISRSADALLHIINDILDYSKIESGNMNIESIELNLSDLIQDSLSLFSGTARTRNIELVGNIDAQLPEKIIGDPTRLKQILSNLLGNAFKFTKSGSIYVDAKYLSGNHEEGFTIEFSVKDSGIGIDPKVQQSIFDAFQQADSSTSRKYGGTGLGLAICKQLTETMGGKMSLTSDIGNGARFAFQLRFRTLEIDVSHSDILISTFRDKQLLLLNDNSDTDRAFAQHCENYTAKLTTRNITETIDTPAVLEEENYDIIIVNEPDNTATSNKLLYILSQSEKHQSRQIIIIANDPPDRHLLEMFTSPPIILKRPVIIGKIFSAYSDLCLGKNTKPSSTTKNANEQTTNSKSLHLLIAEDNAVNRMVINGLLKKLGIERTFAENGIEAVEKFCQKDVHYDAVLMDCEMPEMDGFDATIHIREWERAQSLESRPIIALTAHVEAEHRRRVVDVGMNFYVSKPVNFQKVKQALETFGLM